MATTFADLEARVRGLESRAQRAEEDITAIISTVVETRDDVKQLTRDAEWPGREDPLATGDPAFGDHELVGRAVLPEEPGHPAARARSKVSRPARPVTISTRQSGGRRCSAACYPTSSPAWPGR